MASTIRNIDLLQITDVKTSNIFFYLQCYFTYSVFADLVKKAMHKLCIGRLPDRGRLILERLKSPNFL
jgi:hypothetical protein